MVVDPAATVVLKEEVAVVVVASSSNRRALAVAGMQSQWQVSFVVVTYRVVVVVV